MNSLNFTNRFGQTAEISPNLNDKKCEQFFSSRRTRLIGVNTYLLDLDHASNLVFAMYSISGEHERTPVFALDVFVFVHLCIKDL